MMSPVRPSGQRQQCTVQEGVDIDAAGLRPAEGGRNGAEDQGAGEKGLARLEIGRRMAFALTVSIVLLAFMCELIDSSLGMAYGTTLMPLLLVLGYEPTEIVSAVWRRARD